MSSTLVIDVRDVTVPPGNNVNIAIINQPNPVVGFTATASQIRYLINFSKYYITDSSTGDPITGDNFYELFPEEDPHGGGGTPAVLIDKSITENGVYNATDDSADGYSSVDVNVKTGAVPVFYEVTPASDVSEVTGKPVKIGPKVTWTGRVTFKSSVSGDKLAFILPEEIRPFTKYLFKCGNGGYGFDYTGYILPNGEVHIAISGNSAAIVAGDFSWDVITPEYQVSVDTTKVSSSSGGIQIIDNMAIMQVSITMGNFSTGWQTGLFTVPPEVPIPSYQFPFCVIRRRNTAQYPDTIMNTNGTVDSWLDRTLVDIVDFVCIWDINE